jgi:hypothetical protein
MCQRLAAPHELPDFDAHSRKVGYRRGLGIAARSEEGQLAQGQQPLRRRRMPLFMPQSGPSEKPTAQPIETSQPHNRPKFRARAQVVIALALDATTRP